MRDVRESTSFTARCRGLGLHPWLLDRMLYGILWALHTDANYYPAVPGTPYRVVHTTAYPGKPELVVFYQVVNDDLVQLEWVEFMTEDPAEPLKQ